MAGGGDTKDPMDALRRGEPDAVDAFYREHAELVLGWVIRLGGPGLDAEEVAQDVFVVALRKIESFRGEAKVSTWLFAVTRNVVRNARRRAALRRFVGLDDAPPPEDPTPGADARLDELRRRRMVQRALERLDAVHREVLVLCDLEERPAPEVGSMLGVPVGTVYSRLHHARRAFATAVAREGFELAPVGALP